MRALGLAAVVVVMGVFLPKVLEALQTFLLTFFHVATRLLEGMPTSLR